MCGVLFCVVVCFLFVGGGGVKLTHVHGSSVLLGCCMYGFYRELDLLFIVSATFTSWIIAGAVRRVQRLQDDENLWLTVTAIHSQYVWSFQEQSKEYNAFKTMVHQENKRNTCC